MTHRTVIAAARKPRGSTAEAPLHLPAGRGLCDAALESFDRGAERIGTAGYFTRELAHVVTLLVAN
jgi:hypothetical protein